MSAYATRPTQLRALPSNPFESGTIDALVAQLADLVASRITQQLTASRTYCDEWLDSRHAADYLGLHRDTLRKLAAERAIPSEQDGPGCKLYFLRSELDSWRHRGGRPRRLALAF